MVGDFASKALRAGLGVTSKIDSKGTQKILQKMGTSEAEKISKSLAYKGGRQVTGFLTDGIRETASSMQSGNTFKSALKSTYTTNKVLENGQFTQQLNMSKIMGTATAVSLGGRAATGGGLYRDRYGNINVPGVPFI